MTGERRDGGTGQDRREEEGKGGETREWMGWERGWSEMNSPSEQVHCLLFYMHFIQQLQE